MQTLTSWGISNTFPKALSSKCYLYTVYSKFTPMQVFPSHVEESFCKFLAAGCQNNYYHLRRQTFRNLYLSLVQVAQNPKMKMPGGWTSKDKIIILVVVCLAIFFGLSVNQYSFLVLNHATMHAFCDIVAMKEQEFH